MDVKRGRKREEMRAEEVGEREEWCGVVKRGED